MANSASARKRVRQNIRHRAMNRWRKTSVREQVKSFLRAVHDQNIPTAETEYRKTCSLLDKLSATSTLHRNAAARRKSRLSRRLKDLKAKVGK